MRTIEPSASPTGTQFGVGNYKCRYAQALDQDMRPTGEYCVWLWNGHYWGLLVRDCTDLEMAKYSATQELLGNCKAR
jgi:hypothetical protein